MQAIAVYEESRVFEYVKAHERLLGITLQATLAEFNDVYGLQARAICRNRKTSYYDQHNGQTIVLGWQQIMFFMRYGYYEYPSLEWMVPKPRPVGLTGVFWLLCHEYAHAVQHSREGRRYGSVHNAVFVEAVQELHAMWPFGDLRRWKQMPSL